MILSLAILLLIVSSTQAATPCELCISNNQHFCPLDSTCVAPSATCVEAITKALDCPTKPNPANGFNDTFARNYVTVLLAAEYAPDPSVCFRNQIPTVTYNKKVFVKCAGVDTTCHGYTAWDSSTRTIIVAFEGTSDNTQLTEEILSFGAWGNKEFFDIGRVYAYFYDAFLDLWNGGLQKDLQALKYQFPDYQLLVTGHSLGASIASVAASYVVKTGMFDPLKTKLMTFGQPRTGDYAYASWQFKTFPYSYRVVHHKDPVPHVPPQVPLSKNVHDELYHHKYEVWYDNDMTIGQPYTICGEADGFHCSNRHLETVWDNHLIYFNRDLYGWGSQGCPKP